jgi:hypothetical protein
VGVPPRAWGIHFTTDEHWGTTRIASVSEVRLRELPFIPRRVKISNRLSISSLCAHSRGNKSTLRSLIFIHSGARRNASTSLVMLFARRVPFYLSLPVIVGCGAAGYVASAWRPGLMIKPTASPQPSVQSDRAPPAGNAVEESSEQRRELAAREVSAGALPTEEIDLPTPLGFTLKVVERNKAAAALQSPPSSSPLMEPAQQAPRDRPRTASHTRPAERTGQQRTSPPPAPTKVLKNIPIIGPVFSLLQ